MTQFYNNQNIPIVVFVTKLYIGVMRKATPKFAKTAIFYAPPGWTFLYRPQDKYILLKGQSNVAR